MFLVSFVAMSLRPRRRLAAASAGAALAIMRAPLRKPPWENPRRGDVATPGSRHAGARASALSCRPCRKNKKRLGVAGERARRVAGNRRSAGRRLAGLRQGAGRTGRSTGAACAGRGDGDPHRGVAVRPAGVDRPHRRRRDPRRPPAGQHLREPRRRRRPARARPPELCAGRADLGARLRRPLDLRHPRRAPLRRRHPGDAARRPGPDHQRRPRLGRQHRGPARPVLGALRQLLGRRHPGVHRRGQRPADRRRQRRPPAATARCASA